MNRGQQWLAATVLIGGILSATQVYRVEAQAKPAQLIGTVDPLRVNSPEWSRWKTEFDALSQKRDTYQSILAPFVTAQNPVAPPIDSAALTAWIKLREQVALNPGQETDQNKKDLAGYESQAKNATDQFNALVNKGDKLTDVDKATLSQLQDLQQRGNAIIVQQLGQYRQMLNDDAAATQTKLDNLEQDAINKVAQEQNITYVFNGTVLSDSGGQKLILYSSDKNIDITDQLLKKLNK